MRLAPLALLSLLAACVCGGPHGDQPQDDPSCEAPSGFAEPAREQGRVYLRGIDDDSPLPVTMGPQGGCMVTPTVCVEAPWLEGQYDQIDSACMILSFANEVVDSGNTAAAPAVSEGSQTLTRFERYGYGTWCARSAWNYLDDCTAELGGTELQMQFEVRGSGGDFARGQTRVLLQAPGTTSPSPWM